MTESMVEKVARALARNDDDGRFDSFSDKIKAAYLADARAAIEAMREPTEAMLERGPGDPYMDKHVWANMLDAALSPGEQDG